MTTRNSRLPGFYRKSMAERRAEVAQWCADGDLSSLESGGLSEELCDRMVENAIGRISLPVGVATNFQINGADLLVPMAVEEPSVIAAASNAAKIVRQGGGFVSVVDPSLTVAQVELLHGHSDAEVRILAATAQIIAICNNTQPQLIALGGGVRAVEVRPDVGDAARTVVHLVVDCLDAMGANMVNTMAETVSPFLCEIAGATSGLRILTNLADRRLARASCTIPFAALSRSGFEGRDVARGVSAASDFAIADPWRAATHNKGIFNGVDAVLLATGNDWRAVEAGGHAFAARSGQYSPLATWVVRDDQLCGQIEMPMAVGIVGGASRNHPAAARCIEIAGVKSASDLASIAICAGLASNLAALAALSSEGIQQGHMKLHGRRL